MKKSFFAVLVIVVVAFMALIVPASVMAGDLTETIVTPSTGKVISTSAVELFAITVIDVSANTAVARALHFYNNVSIQVSDSPLTGYLFSAYAPVGTYFTKDLFKGAVYTKWGYSVFDGITCSSGLTVSPTAGTGNFAPQLIIQYK